MNHTFKGLKIGNVVITTKTQLEKCQMTIEAKEILDLFVRAIKENKIKFD